MVLCERFMWFRDGLSPEYKVRHPLQRSCARLVFLSVMRLKMVTLTEVIASNKRITSTFPNGLVAVFVGGTSGVGEYTVKKFAKYTSTLISRVYIVGRSQEAADRILADCRLLSPGSKFEFIKADVSLLKEVDQVCKYIKSKESKINILFLTQASMAFKSSTSGSSLTQTLSNKTNSLQPHLKGCLFLPVL